MTKIKKYFSSLNFFVTLPMIFLCVIGIIMVYSASYYSAGLTYNNEYYFLTKQIVGVVIGTVVFIVLSNIDYRLIKKVAIPLIIISVILLAIVFIPGIGFSNYGATRWINLGLFTFQPSEIAKFGFVIFCAYYLDKNIDKMSTLKKIIPIILAGGIICLLIMLEPNMSITICVGLVMLFMIFISGASKKLFAALGIIVALAVPLLIVIEPYRIKRLVAFIDPWSNYLDEGYQLVQSLYSLGAGGFFGVGLFNSRQKFLFLPFSESDFIFSIIGEEFGLFGVLIIILLFLFIIFNGTKIAASCRDAFGTYLASGITAVITAQVLVNIAVVTGSIPPTGVPLPFISAGSTSIVVFMGAIGVLNNIYIQNKSWQIL